MEEVIFPLGLVSTVLLALGYLPLTIKTVKYKQTFGISIWFTIFIIAACVFWVIYGMIPLIAPWNESVEEDKLSIGLPILLANAFLIIINGINLFIKLSNMKKAKAKGISEKEYCDMIFKSGKGEK